jgi:outer membrane protein OmpA-like peptidoglycan-associated protein
MSNISAIHGITLSAWAFAGLTGNQMAAWIVSHFGTPDAAYNPVGYQTVLYVTLALYVVALLLSMFFIEKAKKEAEAIANAQVTDAVDANGYQAVKVTFDSGILFQSGKSVLSAAAQSSLTQFATNVLGKNADMNVGIVGFTDNDPWKGKTAEQSVAANQKLSEERAEAVSNFLQKHGAAANQIKEVVGLGESNPVADNSTAAGKQQNRRVEVYLYASQEMIDAAKEGTLK